MIEIRQYVDRQGHNPFENWFLNLDQTARARITVALERVRFGNFSAVKGVGAGVFEFRLSFGPGYRIYFGKDGDKIVILVGGGTKKRQQYDIAAALENWKDYKRQKRTG